MGKLSRIELDVVSNEVYSKVVNEVNDKCLKIVNENVDFSLFKELREVELKKEKLENELNKFVDNVKREIEKELILGGIDKGLDIKELINNMVKEFVSKEFKS